MITPPPLQPLMAGQCALLLGNAEDTTPRLHGVDVRKGNNSEIDSLWFDSLYIQFVGKLPREALLRISRSLWVTNVTLQNDSQRMTRADKDVQMMVSTARVFAAGETQDLQYQYPRGGTC